MIIAWGGIYDFGFTIPKGDFVDDWVMVNRLCFSMAAEMPWVA